MRDHATIKPTFWTRGTGKMLRGHPEAQLVALYLMTCASSSMVGIYHVGLPTIAHETGLTLEACTKGLGRCIEVGFVEFDEAEDLVWVPFLARHQVGESMKAGDRRKLGVIRALKPFHKHRFYALFLALYGESYGLEVGSDLVPLPPSPTENVKGLVKPLGRGFDPAPAPVPDPVPEGVQGGRPVVPAPPAAGSGPTLKPAAIDGPIPEAMLDVVAMVSMNTGVHFDVPIEWAKFQAKCRENGNVTADLRASWEGWLLTRVTWSKESNSRASPAAPAPVSPSRKLLGGGGRAA
jgi:hypothetical protein